MRSPKFRALLEHFPEYINSALRRDEKNKNFYQCPFCGSGTHGARSTGALSVDFAKKTWYCHACGESGGMLQLCMKLERLAGTKEAFRRLYDTYCRKVSGKRPLPTASPAPDPDPADTKPVTQTTDYTEYFRSCSKNMARGGYQYLESRGIPAQLADRFGIGFDPRWEHPKNTAREKHYYTPRLIIPLGRYAYLARDTRPKQKKQFSKLKCGQLRDFFFGEEAVNDPLCFFIVEGEIDCLSVYAAGASAVALGSIARAKRFLRKLAATKPAGLCLVALDNDEAGKAAAKELAAGCRKHGIPYRVVTSLSGPYKDPNEYLAKDPDEFKQKMQLLLDRVRKETAAKNPS